MELKKLSKMNKDRRRRFIAKDVVRHILGRTLFSSGGYVGEHALYDDNDTVVCESCGVGAIIAFACDYNPPCLVEFANNIKGIKDIFPESRKAGFSDRHTQYIEYLFEPLSRIPQGNIFRGAHTTNIKYKYQNMGTNARLLEIWKYIALNGKAEGYEGEL